MTGTQLLAGQHGGDYGSVEFHVGEEFEVAIADKYYSWGWSKTLSKENDQKIKPLPANKLISIPPITQKDDRRKILLVSSGTHRYLNRFLNWNTYDFLEMLEMQFRWVGALTPELRQNLLVRPYPIDYGWKVADRWRDRFPAANLDQGTSFRESLEACRLYVGDHLSTTFLEAIHSNVPTILFWNPKIEQVRKAVQPLYQALRDVGILHDTPEQAAETVEAIYPKITEWWHQDHRQAAINSFRDQFARSSPTGIEEWVAEFKSF